MKLTAKEYQHQTDKVNNLHYIKREAEYLKNWKLVMESEESIKEIQSAYFDKLPTVFVSFYIGSRSYFESVYKIGNSYFKHGCKMTKGRGYRTIAEIPEITTQMQESMLSDSYYY